MQRLPARGFWALRLCLRRTGSLFFIVQKCFNVTIIPQLRGLGNIKRWFSNGSDISLCYITVKSKKKQYSYILLSVMFLCMVCIIIFCDKHAEMNLISRFTVLLSSLKDFCLLQASRVSDHFVQSSVQAAAIRANQQNSSTALTLRLIKK